MIKKFVSKKNSDYFFTGLYHILSVSKNPTPYQNEKQMIGASLIQSTWSFHRFLQPKFDCRCSLARFPFNNYVTSSHIDKHNKTFWVALHMVLPKGISITEFVSFTVVYILFVWVLVCSRNLLSRHTSQSLIPAWASYQIRKIAGCTCTRNAGNVSPTPISKETAS